MKISGNLRGNSPEILENKFGSLWKFKEKYTEIYEYF